MTERRLKLELTEAEVRQVLAWVGLATIENAELLERICLQTGQPIPDSTRQWLAERRTGLR